MPAWITQFKEFVLGLTPSYNPHANASTDTGRIPSAMDVHLVPHTDQNSFLAEQYKLLCRKMFFLAKERGGSFQTILFTSSQPKEGKTTTACNMALTLALSFGKKVLLVDADLRRSSVHRMFGIPRKPGFVELFRGEVPLEACFKQPSPDGLYVLPAGSTNVETSEIFRSHKLIEIIDELKTHFNYILFDAPPILKVSDPSSLGALCDAVLFVIKAGSTPRANVLEALDTLQKTGAQPTACILVNTSSFPDYYSYLTKQSYREYYRNRYIDYGDERNEAVEQSP